MTPISFVYWVVCPSRQTTQWTKEKGIIRGDKEKDRQPNGPKRKGSSETIKKRTDNPMDKRERGHQMSFMDSDDPFSFVQWIVSPSSLYGL
jgi:hypothetical protein